MEGISDLFKGFKSAKDEKKNAIFSVETKNKQKKSISKDKSKEYAEAFKKIWS